MKSPRIAPHTPELLLLNICTDVDLKTAARFFAQKFAMGIPHVKNAQGFDEIAVQGDVGGDITSGF